MDYFNQESERLIFRKLTTKDIASWLEFFNGNDRLHFLGMDCSDKSKKLVRAWLIQLFNAFLLLIAPTEPRRS